MNISDLIPPAKELIHFQCSYFYIEFIQYVFPYIMKAHLEGKKKRRISINEYENEMILILEKLGYKITKESFSDGCNYTIEWY